MKNGFTSSQLATIRTRPQGAEWYVAIHRPRINEIFLIDGPSTLGGSIVSEIPVISSYGTSTTLANMTGIVFDSNTVNLGEIRIRKDWNGGKLAVAESGSGLINWTKAYSIAVIDQFRPWIKHPRYDTTASQWRMDYDVAYDGQLNNWGPYANLGPPIVALPTSSVYIEESGSITQWVVDFWANESLSIQNILSSGIWTFPDGQTVTSAIGTSVSPVKMTFTGASPGGSYFTFTAVDNTGASHIGRRLIFALNNISEAPRIAISDITGGVEQGGYQARLLSTTGILPEATYPYLDNSEIVLFERANYGSTRSSFGGNYGHRENVIFRGWITQKDIRVGPYSSDMSLTAETVGGILSEADSYDIFLANYQAGGSDWTEMQGLSLDGVAQFALKWRSTVGEICDWKNMGEIGTNEVILYQSLPRGPFIEQLRENYGTKGVLGYFGADLQSNFFAYQDQNINGGSATLPRTNLDYRDLRDDMTITAPPRDTNAQTSLYAVTSDIPYGAESPAHVRGYFGGERVFERGLLVDSQDRLITWAGNYRAKLNSKLSRTNIPLSHNMRLDPVPQSVIRMSMAASDNARGLTWTNKDFLTKELNVTYDATTGYPLWDLSLEEVVKGIGGSSITFPTIDEIIPLPTNPPDPGTIDLPSLPPTTETFGTGFGTVYVMNTVSLGRTRNFSASSPVWVDITGAAAGEDLNDFILDPWRPATTGYLLTDGGVYKSSTLNQTSPSFSNILSSATIEASVSATGGTFSSANKIIASINFDGYVAFIFKATVGGTNTLFCARSSDGGSSWAYSTILASTAGATIYSGGFDYVPHAVNGDVRLYAAVGSAASRRLYRSDNGGASWSLKQGPGTLSLGNDDPPGGIVVHCPYQGNEDGNIVYAGWAVRSGNGLLRSTNSGDSVTVLAFPSSHDGLQFSRTAVETYTLNNQLLYAINGGSTVSRYFYYSTDGGDNYSLVYDFGTNIRATGGFPNNSSQFYAVAPGSGNVILVSTDGGSSWTNKTGNYITAVGTIDEAYGRTVIVPLWTE